MKEQKEDHRLKFISGGLLSTAELSIMEAQDVNLVLLLALVLVNAEADGKEEEYAADADEEVLLE